MVPPMRLVSFRHADAAKIGAVVEGGIVDLSGRTSSRWPSLRDAIAAKALPALAAAAKGAKGTIDFCEPIPIFAVSCTTARMAVAA